MTTFGDSLLQLGMTKFQNSLDQNNKISMINTMDALQKSKLDSALMQTKIRSEDLKNKATEMALRQKEMTMERNAYNAYQKWQESPDKYKQYDKFFKGADEKTATQNFITNNPNASFGFNDSVLDQLQMHSAPIVNYATGEISDNNLASNPNFDASMLNDPRITNQQFARQGNKYDWSDDYTMTNRVDAQGREMLGNYSETPNMDMYAANQQEASRNKALKMQLLGSKPSLPINLSEMTRTIETSELSRQKKDDLRSYIMTYINAVSHNDSIEAQHAALDGLTHGIRGILGNQASEDLVQQLNTAYGAMQKWGEDMSAWKSMGQQIGATGELDRVITSQYGAENKSNLEALRLTADQSNMTMDLSKNPLYQKVFELRQKADKMVRNEADDYGITRFIKGAWNEVVPSFTPTERKILFDVYQGDVSKLPRNTRKDIVNKRNEKGNIEEFFKYGAQKTPYYPWNVPEDTRSKSQLDVLFNQSTSDEQRAMIEAAMKHLHNENTDGDFNESNLSKYYSEKISGKSQKGF